MITLHTLKAQVEQVNLGLTNILHQIMCSNVYKENTNTREDTSMTLVVRDLNTHSH